MNDDFSINNLRIQINESNRILYELDQQISKLKNLVKMGEVAFQRNNQNIYLEKMKLEREKNDNKRDIQDYKSQLIVLQNKIESQKNQINVLTKENQVIKSNIRKNSRKSPSKKGIHISDLRKSLCLDLMENSGKNENKNDDENEDEMNLGFKIDEKEDKFKDINKAKKESEIILYKLQDDIIGFYKETNNQITYITNYSNYIYSINKQINSFRQQLRVSVVGEAEYNFSNKSEKNVEQLIKDMEIITFIINQVNQNIYIIKNETLKKAENILRLIKKKLLEINKNKKLSFGFLLNKMDYIERQIENLKKLCQVLNRNLNDIINQRKQIENNIDKLKRNLIIFMNNFKEGKKRINDAIHKSIIKTGKNIFNSINKSLRKEENDEDDNKYNKMCEDLLEEENKDDENDDLIKGSTLVGINDFYKDEELFKTTVLFKNNKEREENKIKQPKIIRKNWNEVCYIYDDFDVHDINLEIKAVGLGPFSFFNSCSMGFHIGKHIEIEDLEINGKKSKYIYNNYCLEYKVTLYNLQTAKIHLRYKESPKFNSMPPNKKLNYKFFRREIYGLSESLVDQMGKFRLILKGSFEIVSFKEYFFIRNEKNKTEKEYIWGGKVPFGGKKTLITLSKNEASWRIYCNIQILNRRGNLRNTTLKVPIGFIGGNNEIIKMNYSSPQTKNIRVDEENRVLEIRYKNTEYQSGDFIISGEIKNRCKGDWNVDLTDEIIEKNMPDEDKRDKEIFEKIARDIIAEFDRKNKEDILVFMDFTKIGKWVYNNIRFDLNYCGRTDMTAMDIYNQRVGVCHHMTKLANALLYSIGYKVIYVNGFACESSEFDENCAHAWSLIQVNGKWYPFDATWNILTGKLPVSHVFQGFFGKSMTLFGIDGAIFGGNTNETGKFLK